MKETLESIAKRTGVSKTTVSRVLSGKADTCRISKDTIRLVKEEAKRCGYKAKHVERHLRQNNSKSIGLLVPSLRNQYFAELTSALISEINRRGYNSIIVDTEENGKTLRNGLSTLLEKKVEGFVVVPCDDDPMFLEQIDRTIVPIVLIDRYYRDSPLSHVTTDNMKGGEIATNHFLSKGHRKILCIQGIQSSTANYDRVAGYRKAMTDASNESNIAIVGNDFSVSNGYLETRRILSSGGDIPTAILCLSSVILFGVVKALREAGLRIPEDISVVSYDHYMYLDYFDPPITSINQPVDDMGAMAIKILFNRINDGAGSGSRLQLTPSLIEGKSVADLL